MIRGAEAGVQAFWVILRVRLWVVLAIFAVFAADRAVKRLLLSGAVELSGTALIPGVATSSRTSFQRLQTRVAVLADDEMVVHGHAQWPHDLDDRPRYLNVGARSAPYSLSVVIFQAPEKALELRVAGAFRIWRSAKVQGARSGRRR